VTGTPPPVRRRLLGSALREYRVSLGYNLDEAARILECDRSKISRIETGDRGIRGKELRELLTEYGVPATEQEALLAIAHHGRASGWWLDYSDVLSAAAQDYVILESAATEIIVYEANQVPDLLQTADYMRAVAEADARYTSSSQRAHATEVKLNRQRIVLGDRAPGVEIVITEGALRQVVGPPWVMREQLAVLADAAETGTKGRQAADAAEPSTRISLRVLPFAAGAHAAAGAGPMTLLRFAEAPEIGVVHLAALSGGVSLEGREEVSRYLRTFTQLSAASLTAARSARLIRVIAGGLNR
jgi:transcriptional regulator with XRE-family HTH domain